jgi:hypothetical protein
MGQGPFINLLVTYFDIPSNMIAGLQYDLKHTKEGDLSNLDTKLNKLKLNSATASLIVLVTTFKNQCPWRYATTMDKFTSA